MSIKTLIIVAVGGGLGTAMRYAISVLMSSKTINTFPVSTFLVNILGCFFIGVLAAAFAKNNMLTQNTYLFFATGFCGGFTTFSAFAYENLMLLKNGNISTFLIYMIASFSVGIISVFAGYKLIGTFNG